MAEEKVQSLQRSLDQALHENKKYYKKEQETEYKRGRGEKEQKTKRETSAW